MDVCAKREKSFLEKLSGALSFFVWQLLYHFYY